MEINFVSKGWGNAANLAICRAMALREMLDTYFQALNAYDADGLLPLLEDGYRADQESAIRTRIDELKAGGTQLSWTENQAAGKTGSMSMAMLISVDGGPSGTEEWVVGFLQIGARDSGEWTINFVNVKE